MAAIMALACFRGDNHIIVTTDSRYLRDGMISGIYMWESNGYKTATGGKRKNRALWEDLHSLQLEHAPYWEWVKGHSGDKTNDLVDNLALQGRQYAEKLTKTHEKTTTLHNLFNVNKKGKGNKECLMHGKPRIYLEEY